MLKNVLVVAAAATLLAAPQHALCQDHADTGKRLFSSCDHYIGVQINELTRQILSVNNSDVTNNNPFLLTYQLTDRRTGWGLRGGIGYSMSKMNSESNQLSNSYSFKTNTEIFNIRAGFEKKYTLADHWEAGAGIDLIYRYNRQTGSYTSYGSNVYDSSSRTNMYGAEAMAWLRYGFTKRIFVGTEMSYYYLTGTSKTKITDGYPPYGGLGTDTKTKSTDSRFNLPVTFYFIIKF